MRKELFAGLSLVVLTFFMSEATASALVTNSPNVTSLTATSAEVTLLTDAPSMYNYVTYGTTTGKYPFTSQTKCTISVLTTGTAPTANPCIKLINLIPETMYYYKMIAVTTASTSAGISSTTNTAQTINSNENSFTTLSLNPSIGSNYIQPVNPPSILPIVPTTVISVVAQVSPTNESSVIISWTTASKNTSRFELTRTPQGGTPVTLSTSISSSTTSYTDTLTLAGNYVYSVKACIDTNCSPFLSGEVTLTVPQSPLTPSATLANGGVVALTWKDNSSNETKFEIYRGTSTASFILVGEERTNAITHVDTNTIPGTYFYAIAACNILGCSSKTYITTPIIIPTTTSITPVQALTPTLTITPPTQPTNLHIATSSASSILISWTDVANETLYKITRIPTITPVTLSANTTTYTDTGLLPGVYSYTVQACKDSLCSASVTTPSITIPIINIPPTTAIQTPVVCAGFDVVCSPVTNTIPAPLAPTAPPSPTSVAATQPYVNGLPATTIHITWNNTSTNQTRIKIYRSSTHSSIELPIIGSNITMYDDINLLPDTYSYYISACNAVGCSPNITTNTVVIPEVKSVASVATSTDYGLTSPSDISNAFGKVVPGSFIYLTSSSNKFSATALQDGSFLVKVPDGVYRVEGITPLKNPDITIKTITVTNSKIISTVEEIAIFTKKISGKVALTSGSAISGAEVGAYKKETGQWITGTTDTQGLYSLEVSGGVWDVVARPTNGDVSPTWEPSTTPASITLANDTKDETKTLNLVVNPLTSNLVITVSDESGNPVPAVGIAVDTISSLVTTSTMTDSIRKVKTEITGLDGTATIHNTAGMYFIHTLIGNTLPYIEATEQQVVLKGGETRNITITLKKEVAVTTNTIHGVTKFDNGITTEAFVSAWSNEGSHAETKSLSNGTFSFDLISGQTWHIRATKDSLTQSYVSDEQTIAGGISSKIIELVFVKNDSTKLPPLVTTKNDITAQSTLVTDNGARFNLPPNGVNGSGTINVAIKATVEAPSRSASTLVSTAYDITVKDNAGQKISKLNKEAEILIPYDSAELTAKGVALENVIPSYYDETISAWVSVTNFTINKDKKVFVLRVNHLTRFALIAAVDTVAPSSPTNIVTDAITPTDIRITWQNPTSDFNHSKIYRSEKQGTFGDIVAAEVFSNSFIDKTGALGKKIYYYTVRAVDAAGNESSNNNQIAVSSLGNSLTGTNKASSLLLPPGQTSSGEITRMLSLGSKGDDVTALQKALKFDGFYATGPITGYYGKRTENAVFRFQNYYKEELLIPNGYKLGTGVLGNITRKKINEIIVKSGQ